jgi:hypothetical protein
MHYIVAITLLLQASMGLEQGNNVPAILAPRRAGRMLKKRAGEDFGLRKITCVSGGGVCNVTCYHINFVVSVC